MYYDFGQFENSILFAGMTVTIIIWLLAIGPLTKCFQDRTLLMTGSRFIPLFLLSFLFLLFLFIYLFFIYFSNYYCHNINLSLFYFFFLLIFLIFSCVSSFIYSHGRAFDDRRVDCIDSAVYGYFQSSQWLHSSVAMGARYVA
jgi:hypothetical protein